MVPVPPYAPAATEDPVHSLGHTDSEALDTPGKRAAVFRLDNEMEVIALHGELENPKTTS